MYVTFSQTRHFYVRGRNSDEQRLPCVSIFNSTPQIPTPQITTQRSTPQITTHRSTVNLIKLKVRSYIKRYPVLALFKAPTHPAVYSFQSQLNFSGKHTATLQLLHEEYLFTYPPLPLAYYSLVRLNEMKQRVVKEIVQASKRQQEFSNPYFVD